MGLVGCQEVTTHKRPDTVIIVDGLTNGIDSVAIAAKCPFQPEFMFKMPFMRSAILCLSQKNIPGAYPCIPGGYQGHTGVYHAYQGHTREAGFLRSAK
jgi:hypothetical protein